MAEKPKEKKVYAKRGAKKRHIVTPEMIEEVRILAGRGLTQEQLYGYFGWNKGTWYQRCKESPELYEAIFQGRSKSVSFVSGKLMEQVKAGNLSAIIFWLKTKGGFSETNPAKEDTADSTVPNVTINVTDPVEAAKVYQQIMLRE